MARVKICDGRSVLYQYDTGVLIELCDCRDFTECHFVTENGLIRREVANNICSVPDVALVSAGTLTVYAFSRNADGGQTQHNFFIHVMARPKPADYIDPPDEVDNIDSFVERMKEVVKEGVDGGYYSPAVSEGVLTWNASKEGMPSVQPANIRGPQGETGVGIHFVGHTKVSTDDGGDNEWTMILTDGQQSTLTVKNGSKGSPGADGKDGKDGYTPVKGKDYFDGEKGDPGEPGKDGYTPIKGVDYFDGAQGDPGKDGVGIASLEQTTTSSVDGGSNVWTATLTDGSKKTFTVKNGSKGSPGEGGSTSKYAQPEWGAEIGLVDILPETEFTVDEAMGVALGMQEVALTVGDVYTVTYNGTDYACTAYFKDGMPGAALGNLAALEEGAPATDDPFIIVAIDEEYRENYDGKCLLVVPLDGSTTFTLAIKIEGEIIHTIPFKYLATADGQPTWGMEKGMSVLKENTVEVIDSDSGMAPILLPFSLTVGQEYTVNWNGTEYKTAPAIEYNGGVMMGNVAAIGWPTNATEEPYIILAVSAEEAASEGYYGAVMPLDGSTSVTLSITGDVMTRIPGEYLQAAQEPLIVRVVDGVTDIDFRTIDSAIDAGRTVYLAYREDSDTYKCSFACKDGIRIAFMSPPNTNNHTGDWVFNFFVVDSDGHVSENSMTVNDNSKTGTLRVYQENDGSPYSNLDIYNAYRAGQRVEFHEYTNDGYCSTIWQPVMIGETKAIFSRTYISDGNVVVSTVTIDNNVVTVEEKTIAASGT